MRVKELPLTGWWKTLNCRIQNKKPVLVYQMAKVGSRSVVDSLEKHGMDNVFHVHRLNPPVNRYGMRIKEQFIDRGIHMDVITLVRDPVARNMSGWFGLANRACFCIDLDDFVERFISYSFDSDPLTWFDDELSPVMGIDIYRYKFPKSGWQVIEKGNVRLLVLKLETCDRILEEAISSFLGLDGFRFTRCNVTGRDKPGVADFYLYVKRNVVLPLDYLDGMYGSRFVRHFYSDDEIAGFRRRYGR